MSFVGLVAFSAQSLEAPKGFEFAIAKKARPFELPFVFGFDRPFVSKIFFFKCADLKTIHRHICPHTLIVTLGPCHRCRFAPQHTASCRAPAKKKIFGPRPLLL